MSISLFKGLIFMKKEQETKELFEDKLHEECAVFGVSVSTNEAVGLTYNGLLSLQHRGQEGAGIAVVSENKNIICQKELGLVTEVFQNGKLKKLPEGNVAIGHARYSTTGTNSSANVGPFVTEFLTGRIAVAHNGNLTNAKELRDELKSVGVQFNASSDSEVVSKLFAYHVVKQKDLMKGVVKAANLLKGAFSIIILVGDKKLIVIRDKYGFRPLCIGKSEIGLAVASESCALNTCGFELIEDVLPGDVVVIENGEIIQRLNRGELQEKYRLDRGRDKRAELGLCVFEYVYFARPDSVIEGLSVYDARINMGRALAKEHPIKADIVCGVPDSGLEAAIGYSQESGIPLASGFVKNRYVGRSFIYPTQGERDSIVKIKLNPLSVNVKDKIVILVDDSIVRGTTIAKIVSSLKKAGAKEIHLRISSPPFRFTCHYGTDVDSEDALIANKMTIPEIAKNVGADSIGYISLEGLKNACKKTKLPLCTICFTGGDCKWEQKSTLEDVN
ncbi:MAG: amidophosphoribosyltransferase [Firmicutes bacterium]|nr:amidophosphoribosyltransferase [Bacillota bacterium]